MSQTAQTMDFDFVIIGAGSAGCVLANRLSADGRYTVCLVEAGGSDSTPRVQVPAGTITLYKSPQYSYNFESAPQTRLNGRSLHCPRGKVLGGSSSMNSMIYIRGMRSDYDGWSAAGCKGWAYDDLLPFFKRSEGNRLGQDETYHGTGGELSVDRPRDPNPLSQMFIDAARGIGLPHNSDFNAGDPFGVGVYDVTQKAAHRLSSYRAFVHPVLQRKNLTLLSDCRALSLRLEGNRVHGVYVEKDGTVLLLNAKREVVLAAGAIGSPHLMLMSGIGDAAHLRESGIDVKHHLAGVGRNLQDHLDGLVTVRSSSAKTLGFSLRSLPKVVASPFKYLLRKKGWLTTNYVEAGGFARTRYAAGGDPDVQFHFVPGYRSHRGRLFEYGHGFAIHTCVLRPKSIGMLTLSREDKRAPLIDYNFLAREEDARVLIEGIKLARSILASPVFDPIRGKEMLPGAYVQSDVALLDYIRAHAATVFHPAGTCKMGIDAGSVVDPQLKVIGLEGLRVADASIMPTLVSGNTNAPSIMIGEKAADMMLADARRGKATYESAMSAA
ncbi:GMC family oxidoreductase [Paraburkholderia sp. D1E]|uniref:GMC family oxidoreductase n=1 Tax=Paraburkholderia sp. D1E TaxID=3461398 RepID=UPI004045B0F4